MKRIVLLLSTALALAGAGVAAADNPPGTGQPSQTCLTQATGFNEPGQAAAASGSAFNETSPGTAGTVYAGNGANTNTPANGNAVSQYDVACFQVSH